MLSRNAFLWLVALLIAIPALATDKEADICGGLPALNDGPFAPNLGKFIPEQSDSKKDAYLLYNHNGTTLVRFVPKEGGPSYIEKYFLLPYKCKLEFGTYKFLEENAKGNPDTFRMIHVSQKSDRVLVLEDVRGRNLREVLKDEAVSPEIKAKLREHYLTKLKALEKILDKKGVDCQITDAYNDLPILSSDPLRDGVRAMELSIRSDQVVVTFNPRNPMQFELTLVDGY